MCYNRITETNKTSEFLNTAAEAKENTKMTNIDKMVEMMKAAYIEIMGVEKWNSLTEEEQHDAIMFMVKDATKALDRI